MTNDKCQMNGKPRTTLVMLTGRVKLDPAKLLAARDAWKNMPQAEKGKIPQDIARSFNMGAMA